MGILDDEDGDDFDPAEDEAEDDEVFANADTDENDDEEEMSAEEDGDGFVQAMIGGLRKQRDKENG